MARLPNSNLIVIKTAIAPRSCTSLVFVDSTVDDFQSLISGILANTEVVVLQPGEDGITQITDALKGYTSLHSVHIVSHGSPASLRLGYTCLSLDSLSHYQNALQQWRSALSPHANILLYGCDVAATEAGKAFVAQLKQILGVEIAASTTRTGSPIAGGNWHLDFTTGAITASLAFHPAVMQAYPSVFPAAEGADTYVDEDFSDASGVMPPPSWTIEVLEGNATTDLWRFDNPAGRGEYLDYLEDPVAIYDSDFISDDGLDEDVALETPVFDASDAEGVFLTFDQYYGGIAAGVNASEAFVEVYNGSEWVEAYSTVADAAGTTTLDLTDQLAGVADAQVRFRFDGNWSYYWAVDNVEIVEALAPGVNLPTGDVGVSEDNVPDPLDFTFSLQSRPDSDVTFSFEVDETQLQAIESITFTPENWNIAQTVTVNAVSDDVAEEEVQISNVGVTVSSDDANYSGLTVEDVPVEVTESTIPGFNSYRTVEETFADLSAIATANPDLADWVDIGDSYDKATEGGAPGYDIFSLELGNKATDGLYEKPVLFVQGSIHAREYTTAELVTRFAEELTSGYGTDADLTWLLDYVDIRIVPYVNPDGRKFAEQGYSWRKNTNPNPEGSDDPVAFPNYGVDLNRNYDSKWGEIPDGASTDPADLTYQGPSPFSEPESQALRDYLLATFPDQKGEGDFDPAPDDATGVYLDIHSFGNLVLYPFGWTNEPAPNYEGLRNLGLKFGYFTESTDGDAYDVQQAIGLYPTSGTTDDWVYQTFGSAAYTLELGTEFFESSDYFEETIYPELLPALNYAAKSAYRPYQTSAGPDTTGVSVTLGEDGTATLLATADATRYADGNGNSPPELTEGLGLPVFQNIGGARYSIDAPSWIEGTETFELTAVDGALDTTAERLTATIDTSELTPGQHTIFVESVDAAGNYGVPTAVFLEIPELTSGEPTEEPTETPTETPPENDRLTGAKKLGNLIRGTEDDDLLKGTKRKDTFVLEADQGTDVIRRFTRSKDQLGLSGDLNFEDLSIEQRGKTSLISYEDQVLAKLKGGNSITLSESSFVSI